MRFKTRILVEKVPHLLRLAQALERLEKLCVFHLCAAEHNIVRFVVQPSVEGSVAAYAQLKCDAWFEGYRIESQNGNQIGLEMDLQNMIRALRSAAAADEILMKLAKKGVPVLTFEIRTHLGPILQDVPVTVLSAARLAECREPDVEESVYGFTLPSLAKLHSGVERMKGLGNRLHLHAKIGERFADVAIEMLTDNVTVTTTYKQLARASMTDSSGVAKGNVDEDAVFEGIVDLRNLRCALFGHQTNPKHAICFILRHCVLVHFMADGYGGADVSYYIPKYIL